jgi:excisionase family DNA binding protein
MRLGVTADPKKPYSERNGKLVTSVEAADYLAVTERQVIRLTYEGKLTPTYVGKLRRYSIADLDAFIETNRRPAAG